MRRTVAPSEKKDLRSASNLMGGSPSPRIFFAGRNALPQDAFTHRPSLAIQWHYIAAPPEPERPS